MYYQTIIHTRRKLKLQHTCVAVTAGISSFAQTNIRIHLINTYSMLTWFLCTIINIYEMKKVLCYTSNVMYARTQNLFIFIYAANNYISGKSLTMIFLIHMNINIYTLGIRKKDVKLFKCMAASF